MRYAQIRPMDVANGPGLRVSVFVTGCHHACPFCFNARYQDPTYGEVWTDQETQQLIECLKHPMISGLTLLGGEPMDCLEWIDILGEVEKVIEPLNLWIYSGYTYEELLEDPMRLALLKKADALVDGPYVHVLRDLRLRFRGSANQRILDVQSSLKQGQPIWLEGYQPEAWQPVPPNWRACQASDAGCALTRALGDASGVATEAKTTN